MQGWIEVMTLGLYSTPGIVSAEQQGYSLWREVFQSLFKTIMLK